MAYEQTIDIMDLCENIDADDVFFNPTMFTYEIPVTVVGHFIPGKRWGDDAHPAEYPGVESDTTVNMYVDEVFAVLMERRESEVLNEEQIKEFKNTAWRFFEREIDKACNMALQGY